MTKMRVTDTDRAFDAGYQARLMEMSHAIPFEPFEYATRGCAWMAGYSTCEADLEDHAGAVA